MRSDLRVAYTIVLAVIAVMLAVGLTGLIATPIENLLGRFRGESSPSNLGVLLAYFTVIGLFSQPTRREVVWVLAVGAASAPLFWYLIWVPFDRLPAWFWALSALPGFGLASLAALSLRLRDPARDAGATRTLLAACGLVPLAGVAATSGIDLTIALHPATFDLQLHRFDLSLGFNAATALGMVFEALPPVRWVVKFAYQILPYCIFAVFA